MREPEGVEVIARVAELLPDVVLMDVDIPKPDGICAIKQIRQDHPSVGVVLADSARGSGESSGRSRQVPVGGTTTPGWVAWMSATRRFTSWPTS